MVDVDRAPEPDDLLTQFINDEWARTRRATQPADNAHDLAGAITANLRLKGFLMSEEFDEDALTVCVTHLRFIPCRTEDGCKWSQHPYAVEAVRNYQQGGVMTVQPDMDALNQQRITERIWEWARAGRAVYKAEAKGDHPIRPSDLIRQAEETK